MADIAIASCKHTFHSSCISEYIEEAPTAADGSKPLGCPVCFVPITIDLRADAAANTDDDDDDDDERGALPAESERSKSGGGRSAKKYSRKSILHQVDLDQFTSSTKVRLHPAIMKHATCGVRMHAYCMRHARCAPYQVEALVTELVKIVDEGLGHKSIVFSQVCFVCLTSAHMRPCCGNNDTRRHGPTTVPFDCIPPLGARWAPTTLGRETRANGDGVSDR